MRFRKSITAWGARAQDDEPKGFLTQLCIVQQVWSKARMMQACSRSQCALMYRHKHTSACVHTNVLARVHTRMCAHVLNTHMSACNLTPVPHPCPRSQGCGQRVGGSAPVSKGRCNEVERTNWCFPIYVCTVCMHDHNSRPVWTRHGTTLMRLSAHPLCPSTMAATCSIHAHCTCLYRIFAR